MYSEILVDMQGSKVKMIALLSWSGLNALLASAFVEAHLAEVYKAAGVIGALIMFSSSMMLFYIIVNIAYGIKWYKIRQKIRDNENELAG